jgi:hypothetical protein
MSVHEFCAQVEAIFKESSRELQRTRSVVARLTAREGDDRLDDLYDDQRHLFS